MSAFFHRLREGGGHVVLDLGPAGEAHLRLFQRYAGKVRFAGLLPTPPRGRALRKSMEALPPNPDHAYDVVFGWDVLDLLEDEERRVVMDRLVHVTGPGALLHLLVTGSGEERTRPRARYTLTGPGTVRREVAGPPRLGGSPLLPADVERLVDPFEVVQGFTLRGGLREYVAVRPVSRSTVGRSWGAAPR